MRAMGERLLAVGPSSSVRFLRLRFLGSPCVAVDASSSASNGSPLVEEELVLLVVLLLRCLGVAPSFHLSIASAPASSFVPLLLLLSSTTNVSSAPPVGVASPLSLRGLRPRRFLITPGSASPASLAAIDAAVLMRYSMRFTKGRSLGKSIMFA